MAKRPRFTDGVEFLEEVFYDAEGNVVDDPKKATTGSVVIRMPDGSIAHHQLVNDKNRPAEVEAEEDMAEDVEEEPEPVTRPRVIRRQR